MSTCKIKQNGGRNIFTPMCGHGHVTLQPEMSVKTFCNKPENNVTSESFFIYASDTLNAINDFMKKIPLSNHERFFSLLETVSQNSVVRNANWKRETQNKMKEILKRKKCYSSICEWLKIL